MFDAGPDADTEKTTVSHMGLGAGRAWIAQFGYAGLGLLLLLGYSLWSYQRDKRAEEFQQAQTERMLTCLINGTERIHRDYLAEQQADRADRQRSRDAEDRRHESILRTQADIAAKLDQVGRAITAIERPREVRP